MGHYAVNGTLGPMHTLDRKIFVIDEELSREERNIDTGDGVPLCRSYHNDSSVGMAMVQWVVFQVPYLLLCIYLPLHITGSREGGRLFKDQLEPPLWICLDGHVAPDDVIVAPGA